MSRKYTGFERGPCGENSCINLVKANGRCGEHHKEWLKTDDGILWRARNPIKTKPRNPNAKPRNTPNPRAKMERVRTIRADRRPVLLDRDGVPNPAHAPLPITNFTRVNWGDASDASRALFNLIDFLEPSEDASNKDEMRAHFLTLFMIDLEEKLEMVKEGEGLSVIWCIELTNRERSARWRTEVLARDGHRCQECGSTERLQAAHIKPKHSHPELVNDLNNGITLCRDCHADQHESDGDVSPNFIRSVRHKEDKWEAIKRERGTE